LSDAARKGLFMSEVSHVTSSAEIPPARSARKSWIYAIGGILASGCAVLGVYAGTGPASSLLMGLAWDRAANGNATLAFQMQTGLSDIQILGGVNGEAFDPRVAALSLTDLTRAAMKEGNDLSPLAWDRLTAGDCISLTTVSGQKLSFRIVGTQAAEASRDAVGAAPNIDLAVTACAPSSDAILKAVIEAKPESKQSAVQRSL
jgi:hypothetical protein